MGCAGSNPLPAEDTVANGRAANLADAPSQMAAADKSDVKCSMVQKMVENVSHVSIDDMVKKIQDKYNDHIIIDVDFSDVSGSMENLMDETQEKLGSLFGKVEQKADDLNPASKDNLNDSTSTIPEKHEIIILTVEETRVIPIDAVTLKNLKKENDLLINETNEEQIINKNQNKEQEVQEPELEEQKVEEPKLEEQKVEEPKLEEQKVEEPKLEEQKVEEEKIEEEDKVEEEENEEKINEE